MNGPLSLDPTTDEVRALTRAALQASNGTDPLVTIRCAAPRCWETLGHIGFVTGHGPLFTSSWVVENTFLVNVNNAPLRPRQIRRLAQSADAARAGMLSMLTAMSGDNRSGVIALLALPPGAPEDFPPLLVRCRHHGDAVLDRDDALHHLRTDNRPWGVEVAFPRFETVEDSSWLSDPTITSP